MPTMKPPFPYTPTAGQLPPDRALIFADIDNRVQRIKESVGTIGGYPFDAWWDSPALNREDTGREYTIRKLMLFYSAEENSSFVVQASGNGGRTWNQWKRVGVLECAGEIKRVLVSLNTTGGDLRFQLLFDRNAVINVFGYLPTLIRRGRQVLNT